MATYSIGELQTLKKKAVDHISDEGHTICHWIYRNKSENYFKEILNNNNGLMTTLEKDRGGDPKNPINGKLKGLFFLARHENGLPQSKSAFGPVRFQVSAQELLRRTPNIYFADFYCLQGNWHYVTLVFTSSDSPADRFCRGQLPRLDTNNKRDNPFLYRENDNWWVSKADYFHVEVFFTDDIRVFSIPPVVSDAAGGNRNVFDASLLEISGAQMRTVPTFGRGSSTPLGLPKDSSCPICNLSPTDDDATSDTVESNPLLRLLALNDRGLLLRRQFRFNPFKRQ